MHAFLTDAYFVEKIKKEPYEFLGTCQGRCPLEPIRSSNIYYLFSIQSLGSLPILESNTV
jgi:hypothetical protein